MNLDIDNGPLLALVRVFVSCTFLIAPNNTIKALIV